MIVAVFCVAAAMIAGGAWAVFTGWELVIIERGWTQVLLGGMLITGGLLLGGIGVLATHVKRLASKLDKLPGKPSAPSLVSDFGPGESAETARPSPPRVDTPIMPPPPPRPEARSERRFETGDDLASEPAGKPEGRAGLAPTAVAVGAAAGAGTVPIWSGLLASDDRARREDEVAEGDTQEPREDEGSADEATFEQGRVPQGIAEGALTEEAPAEEESAGGLTEETPPPPASADSEEAEGMATHEEGIPAPDGEDADMLWAAEGEPDDLKGDAGAETLEAEALEAEASKVEVSREAEGAIAERATADVGQDEAEHVIPPIDEPVDAPVAWREAEAEPVQEHTYSAPVQDEDESADAVPMREDAVADLDELPEADVRETAPDSFDGAQEPVRESFETQGEAEPEEPVEQPERTLVGTYESGGNIYTMYSDGSIDAQTPTGNFHFVSLDELKNFIAQGGEDPLA
jgi:hypothetical protein